MHHRSFLLVPWSASLLLMTSCASPASQPAASDPVPASEPVPVPDLPSASASAAIPDSAPPPGPLTPRIYAKTRFVWVHYDPSAGSGWLGYLWMGGSAELRDPKPVAGSGGCNAWYAVKPRGYVCADGDSATLDPNDPVLLAERPYVPNLASPWPHHYAESRSAERYDKLPTPEEQRAREWELPEHLKQIADAHEGKIATSLEGVDLSSSLDPAANPFELPGLPSTVRERRRRMLPLSTVAYSRETLDGDRSFLLTADYAYVPKDRVVPYPISNFHGTELGDKVVLPIAFFREKSRPKYRIGADGTAAATGESWERQAFVQLTGQSKQIADKNYLETREVGMFTDASDATVVKSQERTPWGAPVLGEDTARGPAGRRTWIETSILGGWLIAYEGTKPVYATLISPGRGGMPLHDVDPLSTASTPTGVWPISGKFATATMVAPGEFIHSDVPWTQNFHGPHALHGAYWHDGWGEKKSAGCVNVSPIDGRWLFYWTDPPLPEGWHGVRFDPEHDNATTFIVHG